MPTFKYQLVEYKLAKETERKEQKENLKNMVSCKPTRRECFKKNWRSQLLNAIEKMNKIRTLGGKVFIRDMDFIDIFKRMVEAEKKPH